MSLKKYKAIRILIVVILAIIVGQSFVRENYIFPIMAIALSFLITMILRKRVKEIMADERDYEIGGRAARIAMQIFSWAAVVVIFALYMLKNRNPVLEPIALTLSYSVCLLMLSYALIFRFLYKK